MRHVVTAWIEHTLAPALSANWSQMNVTHAMRFVVEVVYGGATDAFTIEFDAASHRVSRALDDDYDALNAIAGSMLYDVKIGRASCRERV